VEFVVDEELVRPDAFEVLAQSLYVVGIGFIVKVDSYTPNTRIRSCALNS